MLRKCLILQLVVLTCFNAPAQTDSATSVLIIKQIREIKSKLKNTTISHDKVDLLLELSGRYVDINVDSALLLVNEAGALATKIRYDSGYIKFLQSKGTFYETQYKNYNLALSYYNQAIALAKRKSYYKLIQELYTNQLNLYFYKGEFINAMKVASEGLELSESHKDATRMAAFYNIIGFIYLRQNNAQEAENYYRLFLSYSKQFSDSTTIGDALTCMGEVMLLKKDCVAALSFFKQAEIVFTSVNAQKKLFKKDRLPYILFKLSNAYYCNNDLKTALQYAEKAIAFTKLTSCNQYDIAQYYIFSGNLYSKAKNYKTAKQMLHFGLAISKAINHKENVRDAYLYLHRLFADKKEYDSAYSYYSKYDALKDSIVNESTKREIDQIGSSFQLEKKNAEIRLLNQQKKIQEEQSKKQALVRNLVVIFAVLVMMIVLFIATRTNLKRKNKLQKEINQKQSELFSMTAAIQDNERKRIAQDLHDGMGTLLSAAKLRLSSVQQTPPVTDTLLLLDDATAELRNISHNLMPATLSKLGLAAALQNMIDRLTSENFIIDLITHEIDKRLPEELEIFIYRIILELVNNIVKHSRAGEAVVQVIKYPSKINITVEDDGVGFNLKEKYKGIGITNIRSRVEYLKGTMHIDSKERKGTTIVIDIPC